MMKESKISIKEFLIIFVKSLHISLKVRTKKSLFVGILGLFMAVMPTIISLVLQRLTDEIQILYGNQGKNMEFALLCLGLLVFCYLFQTCFQTVQIYYSKVNVLKIQEYIKEKIMRCSCKVKYKYIDNESDFLNKISLIKKDSGIRVANSVEGVFAWIQSLIAFISVIIVLGQVDIIIILALFFTSIPSVILANKYKDNEYKRKMKWMREGKLVIHQFHDCCAQYSLNEVRFFGLFDFLKEKWRNNANAYIDIKNQMTKKHVAYNMCADFLRNAVYFLILIIVVKQIFNDTTVGLGTFMLVMNLSTDFQKNITNLFMSMTRFLDDIKYMQDFFELENLAYEEAGKQETFPNVNIEFNNVIFSYPGDSKYVLKNINVKIREGEKVAIVGENGSGKTTFVNLILGLYEPNEGTIKIGGLDVIKALHSCREMISAVFQNFGKYEMSILENISISDREKTLREEEIYELIRESGLSEVISNQKEGIYEKIGSLSDDGNNLSGGQWQKIAIARAAYRKNAKILILDEPTAALDPLAEADIYSRFSKLTGEKTTIFVSHRLGICKIVDRILVFDDGEIIEDGSHEALLMKNGLYAKMYKAQSEFYK